MKDGKRLQGEVLFESQSAVVIRNANGAVEQLSRRSQVIWFFRVFYEMPSKDIAVHPEVCMSVNHVDVDLRRSRHAIQDCMRRRGFETHEMPTGTFAELWEAFRLEDV